jgi:hypothetical protein
MDEETQQELQLDLLSEFSDIAPLANIPSLDIPS